jgi:hypothetical protein
MCVDKNYNDLSIQEFNFENSVISKCYSIKLRKLGVSENLFVYKLNSELNF